MSKAHWTALLLGMAVGAALSFLRKPQGGM